MNNQYWFGEIINHGVVTSLLSACYERPYDPEYVAWVGLRGRWFAAYCGGQPVGCYGILPVTYKYDGVLVDTGLVNNVGVVRQHRGGSLFVDLALYAMTEFDASAYLGVSNAAALKGHMRASWCHSHDVAFMEGKVPVGGFSTWIPEPFGAFHVRDDDWRLWRYSKPEECYKVNDGVVYKSFDGVSQIVESSEFVVAESLGVGRMIGVMVRAGGSTWSALKQHKFMERFRRHVVVRGSLVPCTPLRIEPSDYDVL